MTPQEVASTFLGQDRLSVAGQVSNKNPFIVPGIESLFPLKKSPCLSERAWVEGEGGVHFGSSEAACRAHLFDSMGFISEIWWN